LQSRDEKPDSPDTEETGSIGDPSKPEIAPPEQAGGNDGAMADLEKAIARVTRAIANAAEDVDVGELVTERRRMGEELRALRQADAGNVTAIDAAKRRGR
jgi:hypothetical protein